MRKSLIFLNASSLTLHSPQNMSILDIAGELERLKTLSENNKLSTDDVTGGTFSLSNVGAVGGTYASPMLVVPEVCIGAFGKIQVGYVIIYQPVLANFYQVIF